MNDLDLCLDGRIKFMSTIALHLTLNISETVRDRDYWFQWNRILVLRVRLYNK